MSVPASVVAYDPEWPALFRQLRDRVDAALAGVAHVTEHVGSTAVPGLDAKPIIDIDIVVPDAVTVGAAARALAAAGWQHLRDFLRAHPGQAAVYGSLKRRLAITLTTNRLAYTAGKAELISDFLRQARR